MFNSKKGSKLKGRLVAVIIVTALIISAVAFTIINKDGDAGAAETVSKKASVERGNLVVGVVESGNLTIGSVTQDFDLDMSATETASSDTSSDSTSSGGSTSSSSPSMQSQSGETFTGGMTASNTSSSSGRTTTTSSSSSSTAVLEVEEVYVSPGQVVAEGDKVMKLTQASIDSARTLFNTQVTSAQLALKHSQIEKKSTKLSADYEYEANIAKGTTAKEKYDATINGLKITVSKAKKALADADDKLDSLPAQIKTLKKKIKVGTAGAEGEKDLEELERELEETQSGYDNLKTALQNARRELKTGRVTARQEYDESLLDYENASELYKIATDSLGSDVQDSQDALDSANEQLSEFEAFVGTDGVIKADTAGTVVSVGYSAGDDLSSDTAIVTYQDESSVTISVSVTQEDVPEISVGDDVQIVFTAYEDEQWDGKVESIASSESSSSTVTYDVVCVVAGDVSKLYEGMSGTVTFVTKEVDDVLYVSNKAVITEGTSTYVLKGDGDKKVRTEVTTGFSDGANVEITEGLSEGDTVYIESQVNG